MKKILIVEDNEDVRNELTDIFEMEGYQVLEAVNGLEGYLTAANNLPDIVISDIMMPVIDGYKMFKELKSNPLTEEIPIIFLSALSSEDDVRKGMNIGAEDYLKKPVNPDNLIKTTKNKLNKYEKLHQRFDEVKTNITNILYHELNTPLNGIIGFSDYLRTRAHELSSENVKKIAENIFISGKRLNYLVKRYLSYSELKLISINIEEIKKIRNCDYIETSDIVTSILKSEEYNKRKEDITVSIDSVFLKMKEHHFKLLIKELLDNAIKFSIQGEKISVSTKIKDNSFMLKIRNEGIGLPPDKIMKINDFYQMDTKLYAQSGSGIGLSIVKLIMDIYGEDIEFQSIQNSFFEVNICFNKFIRKDKRINILQSN